MSSKNYNLAKIKAFVGDSEITIRKLIDVFLEKTPLMISKIEEGLEQKNYQQINFYAHKLKSSIDNFDVIHLKEDIRLIEKYAKELIFLEELPLLVIKLRSVLETVISEIKKDYDKI